jgi:hypothetical protein
MLGLSVAVLPIILGGSLAMILYAGSDAINLQIDIEENTRITAQYFRQQAAALASLTVPQSSYSPQELEAPFIQTSVQKNYCPQCGSKVDVTDKNCPQCNHDLS